MELISINVLNIFLKLCLVMASSLLVYAVWPEICVQSLLVLTIIILLGINVIDALIKNKHSNSSIIKTRSE